MAVTYTLKETFTGKRTETVPDPDGGEGATKEIEVEDSNDGQGMMYMGDGGNKYVPLSINFLDSPSTTSAITYKLYQKRIGGSGTPSVNRNSDNQTQMILMEVSA